MLSFVPDLSWGLSSPLCRQDLRSYCLLCSCPSFAETLQWLDYTSPHACSLPHKDTKEERIRKSLYFGVWGHNWIAVFRKFTAKNLFHTVAMEVWETVKLEPSSGSWIYRIQEVALGWIFSHLGQNLGVKHTDPIRRGRDYQDQSWSRHRTC